jgi:hypothetical protein
MSKGRLPKKDFYYANQSQSFTTLTVTTDKIVLDSLRISYNLNLNLDTLTRVT